MVTSEHLCGAQSVHNPDLAYGTLTDQEGNVYKTIVIGIQEWMAENHNTSTYRNREPIANVTESGQWNTLTTGVWCFYNNDSAYKCPYGKLYNWHAVNDSRNLCPSGWHVPNDDEWNTLVGFIDPAYNPSIAGEQSAMAGKELKSLGINYWLDSRSKPIKVDFLHRPGRIERLADCLTILDLRGFGGVPPLSIRSTLGIAFYQTPAMEFSATMAKAETDLRYVVFEINYPNLNSS